MGVTIGKLGRGYTPPVAIELDSVTAESIGPPVELPNFTGPLDLLLHLIRANDVSIYDIPIAMICDQYHDYLAALEVLDLDVAGEYLWMASWLLMLKSRMLLPRDEEEPGADPREELVERLLEYRRVKELAALLHDKDLVRRCLWSPAVAPELAGGEVEIDWEQVDLLVLARTYLDVMQRHQAAHPPPLQVLPLRFRVRDKMVEIYQRLQAEGSLALLRHLHGRGSAEEVVVLFVATLELVRVGAVRAEQRREFAEIYLRAGATPLSELLLSEQPESVGGA
jgi:segregation and condensation protein A